VWWSINRCGSPGVRSNSRWTEISVWRGTHAENLHRVQTSWVLLYAGSGVSESRHQGCSYEFKATPRPAASSSRRGEQACSITCVEGWNHRQVFELVRASPGSTQDLKA
jgi:hypothetical protein